MIRTTYGIPKVVLIAGLFLLLFLIPVVSSANGGEQRVVENRYFVSLSKAPFTPRVGVQTSMLASFVDIQTNQLIKEDLIAKIRIARLGGENKRTFIFEQDNIRVSGGVLSFPYTYTETGLHEIFIDFAFATNSSRVYEVPDFLQDVQPAENSNGSMWNMMQGMMGWGWPMMMFFFVFWILVLVLIVLAIIWLIKQIKK